MAQQQLWVVPDGANWAVKKPQGPTLARFALQQEAIDWARKWLRGNGGGELVVLGRDGQIRIRDTVPPARDPYPPRG